MKFEEIDKNFKIETKLDLPDVCFRNVREEPFKIYGVFHDGERYMRMPKDRAASVSANVEQLNYHTAGGRVKFRTNSPYIAISTKSDPHHMTHQAGIGSHGFDLYVGKKQMFRGSFRPPLDMTDGFESVIKFEDSRMREITINFPPYTQVYELYVGLSKGSRIASTSGYKYEMPIVFYGSSITQGGCSSRPGTTYQGFIERWLDTNYVNLGFAGSARGEDEMAEYVAGLDMSIFVYDYDHNAPSLEHLVATHEKMFKTVRQAHPSLPIIFMTRPRYWLTEYEKERFDTIRQTYENAVKSGDENVYFISGHDLMKYAKYDGIVDAAHPTDLGFYSMAKVLTPILRNILKKQ